MTVDSGHQDMVLLNPAGFHHLRLNQEQRDESSGPLTFSMICQVHDVQLDYYGRRLATCSTDTTVKIFDVVGEQLLPVAGEYFEFKYQQCNG